MVITITFLVYQLQVMVIQDRTIQHKVVRKTEELRFI